MLDHRARGQPEDGTVRRDDPSVDPQGQGSGEEGGREVDRGGGGPVGICNLCCSGITGRPLLSSCRPYFRPELTLRSPNDCRFGNGGRNGVPGMTPFSPDENR